MVKIDLCLYSIVMKYAHLPSSGKTIYYRRRIPKGLESYYDGKTFFVKSTGTTDAKLAAAILIRINTQAERDWDRLRQGFPMSVSEEMNASVGQVLAPSGLNSLGRGSEIGKELFIESIFDQLPNTLKHEVVDNGLGGDQLHQAVESVLPASLKIAYGRVNGRINLLASDYCEEYIAELHQIREKLKGDETELGLIIGIVMDTGVRVSECVGLMVSDIVLNVDFPYIKIRFAD